MAAADLSTDVLVIGSGIAGLAAAIEAQRRGARVVIASQGPIGRSSVSARSGGQLALHLPSTSEAGFAEWARLSPLTNMAVARMVAQEAEPLIQGLAQYGVPIRASGEGGYSLGRSPDDRSSPSARLIARMAATARRAGAGLVPGFTATALLVRDGQCFGARGFTDAGEWLDLGAKATVVAVGGAGRLYQPNFGMTGDGCSLLLQAGAELVNMEFAKFFPVGLPTVRYPPQRPGRSFYDTEGLRVVNAAGEDIYQKHLGKTVVEAMGPQYDRFVTMSWIVEKERRAGPVYLDTTQVPAKVWDSLVALGPPGLLARWGGSLGIWKELLAKRVLPAQVISHSNTGGARVGPDMATGVAGLFAGGEVVDAFSDLGIRPLYDIGPLPWAFVTGHVAGRGAASSAAATTAPGQAPEPRDGSWLERAHERDAGVAPGAVMRDISSLMLEHGGPLRNGPSLREGLAKLQRAAARLPELQAPSPRELGRAVAARSMALVSRAILQAALLREESRSEHYREDFPTRDDRAWAHPIASSLNGDGAVATEPTTVTAGSGAGT
jgi:succinate dehydrogenase/fumarate reductase flavoprotein subunit